jgi:hypothetical protein
MIVGCTLDYYIISVLLSKVTTKGNGLYIICKKKKQIDNIDDNKNIDKFGFVASLT